MSLSRAGRLFTVSLELDRRAIRQDRRPELRRGGALITDLLSGQYGQVLRVVAFNPSEAWSRDASEDVARELERHVSADSWEISDRLQDFIEGRLGRKIGVHATTTADMMMTGSVVLRLENELPYPAGSPSVNGVT